MRWLLWSVVLLVPLVAGCQGCRGSEPATGENVASTEPTLRLYLLSDVAGALEPCGCSKDQLGGFDHLAAFIRSDQGKTPKVVLSAGALFFLDPELSDDMRAQDRWKAETLADALKSLELTAFAPGHNDWALGGDTLKKLADETGAKLLATGMPIGAASELVTVGGVSVGIVGVSDPKNLAGSYPDGVTAVTGLTQKVAAEVAALKQKGAGLFVTVVAMPRGAALRIIDEVPELHVMLIGKPLSLGSANTEQPPPEVIGKTLVVETANHAQAVSVVDIHLAGDGTVQLADAGGVAKAGQVNELSRRIRELEHRINGWESGGNVPAADVKARKDDLAALKRERDALQAEQPAPKGSFFRYRVHEVRGELGEDETVAKRMLAFYKQVNSHNKQAFADKKPLPVEDGQAGYIGVEACSLCHSEERAFWDKTAHAHAYETLQTDFKEYNLECVGCHVTGYGKPGGSTVTFNDELRDVQCEDCHGPGSLHEKNPEDKSLITLAPDPQSCIDRCHHPPHVEGFDAKAKMALVLGPGHGED